MCNGILRSTAVKNPEQKSLSLSSIKKLNYSLLNRNIFRISIDKFAFKVARITF
jgi:hypothetical protein